MSTVYDEIEIEDMTFDAENAIFTYPCPCGDKFVIALEEIEDGEEIANCPGCTLRIRVVYTTYEDVLKLCPQSGNGQPSPL